MCIVRLLFHAATSNVVVVAATKCTTNIRSKCMLAFSMLVRKFTQSSFDQASVPFILARWHFLQDRLAIFIHFSDEFFSHLSYHLTRISKANERRNKKWLQRIERINEVELGPCHSLNQNWKNISFCAVKNTRNLAEKTHYTDVKWKKLHSLFWSENWKTQLKRYP